MSRLPLRDLIVSKPRPQTTLSLVPAFRRQAAEMVETYILTDTLRARFAEILESVAQGHGQAFWVQAEYGAGKTHFLVTLAALLSDADGDLWERVSDETIRNYRRRLGGQRLFPVLLSLRGEGSGAALVGRSLLDVLLEEGFQRALEQAGLADQVQVTAAQDLWNWLQSRAGPGVRRDVEAYVQQHSGRPLQAYRDQEGTAAAGRLIAAYCRSAGIRPDIAASDKARLAHVYRQLADQAAYDGLLVVIDEYEGWEKNHNTPEERSTVVASQSAAPAKLRGGQEGDRFVNIPLPGGDYVATVAPYTGDAVLYLKKR